MAPPQATPILCQMKSTVQVSYLWFLGGYNDFSTDVSKQIRVCLHLHENLDMLTSLGQSTQ